MAHCERQLLVSVRFQNTEFAQREAYVSPAAIRSGASMSVVSMEDGTAILKSTFDCRSFCDGPKMYGKCAQQEIDARYGEDAIVESLGDCLAEVNTDGR